MQSYELILKDPEKNDEILLQCDDFFEAHETLQQKWRHITGEQKLILTNKNGWTIVREAVIDKPLTPTEVKRLSYIENNHYVLELDMDLVLVIRGYLIQNEANGNRYVQTKAS